MDNHQTPNNPYYVLRLSPVAEAKACFASICGGGMASGSVELGLFKMGLASGAPYVVGAFAFLTVMSATYNYLEHRAMERGQFYLANMRAPRITV